MSAGIIEQFARNSGAWLAPLNVQQYEAMMQAGILKEGAPIELIDGLLVHKDRRDSGSPGMTIGQRHIRAVKKLNRIFQGLLGGHRLHIHSQQPFTLTELD